MIDSHFHIWTEDNSTPEKRAERADQVREHAERFGVERICLIHERGETVEECREYNRIAAKYQEEHPDLFHAWARANPKWGDEGVREFRRAVEEDGLIGLKLYAQVFLDDERVYPLAEAAVDMDVPIISHVADVTDANPRKPKESGTENVRGLAEQFPKLKLISGHIGGGGVWERRIKNLQHVDNVYLDTSGSVCHSGMLEMAADYLGTDRLVFGTDTWVLPGVGKLRGSDLSPEQKAEIAYNMASLVPDSTPNKLDAAAVEDGRARARARFERFDEPREETIVDANAYLGDFPFRPVDASPEGVLDAMDREGVDRAVVSSTDAVFYRNPHHGNRELADAVEGHENRFIPFATIDPTYPAWEEDLEEAVEEWGMRGVKLFPNHHDYDIDDPAVEALLEKCGELDVPAMFVATIEDQRGRHPRWKLRGHDDLGSKHWGETHADQLIDVLQACPEPDVIVANAWSQVGRIAKETTTTYPSGVRLNNGVRSGETYFVLNDLFMFFFHQGEEIVSDVGTDKLVVGSKMPYWTFDATYINAEELPAPEAEMEAVRSGNLLSLLE